MNKRLLSFVLAAIIALAMMPTGAFAAGDRKYVLF